MKRTRSINIQRMRKMPGHIPAKPLVLAVVVSALVACGDARNAKIYKDVAQCVQDNPSLQQVCEEAYQQAQAKASTSGPKYQTESACVAEFGLHNCVPYSAGGHNWFMPAVAGFMFARALDRNHYGAAPVYTSFSRYSPAYGKWTTVDGDLYGRNRYGSVTVGKEVFKPKPAVTRTISRGGFGSTISAKSSWGGSSYGRSWGG